MSGDNLGSQLVGGFKEGAVAHLKCRHCMGNANTVKTMVCILYSWQYVGKEEFFVELYVWIIGLKLY